MSVGATSVKYVIEAKIDVDGSVDRNDIIGAIFGQTEGIFSSELDFRELQKTGRIGRIEITSTSQGNKTTGKIILPTNLDKFTTALIAAMIESIDRVGPYHAKVTIEKIEDTRAEKKKKIIERARAILCEWEKQKIPEDDEVLKELEEALVKSKVVEFGPDRLPAGPDVESSNELIIVEGRADVINLLRHGYRNVIAVEGVKVPKSISELTRRKKTVIAFLDGDRGGDLILRELLQNSKIDLVARAPYGKEVEELTSREISDALQKAVTADEATKNIKYVAAEKSPQLPEELMQFVKEVNGNLMAIILDEAFQTLTKIPVSELAQKMPEYKNMKYVVFDGVVTQRLVDIVATLDHDVHLIGMRIGDVSKRPPNIHIISADQFVND
ncbi:MAG: DNA primase DnaG [Nitrososphaerota archaeon]